MKHRIWFRLALPLALLFFSFLSFTPPVAHAFDPTIHERILRDALTGLMLPANLDEVVESNKHSDLYQLSPARHFDSAPDRAAICTLRDDGLNAFLDKAVALSAPKDPEKRELVDAVGALDAFGDATHALEDFYSHTNWVELLVGWHEPSPDWHPPDFAPLSEAPLLGTKCDPNAFPEELQTGYFSLLYGADGCPGTGFGGIPNPPPGFRFCHSQINKDLPTGHGAEEALSSGKTFHGLAKEIATRATRAIWDTLHDRIIAKYSPDSSVDAECLFTKLAWGGDRTCHRLWHITATRTMRFELPQLLRGEINVTGLDGHLTWEPVRYLPQATTQYTKITGTWTANGHYASLLTLMPEAVDALNTASRIAQGVVVLMQTIFSHLGIPIPPPPPPPPPDPINLIGTGAIIGQLKVVPEAERPDITDLWLMTVTSKDGGFTDDTIVRYFQAATADDRLDLRVGHQRFDLTKSPDADRMRQWLEQNLHASWEDWLDVTTTLDNP